MKVLVTGSSGFIGNYVVKELLKQNINVIATTKDQNLFNKMEWKKDVQCISCDLSIERNFFEYFNSPEVLIHLAWGGLPNYKSLEHIEKNLSFNYNFLKKMISAGLTNLLVTGTCFEYGLVNGCLDETLTTNPQNSYAIAKDTLRKFLELLRMENSFNFNWLRLFYVYGKGQNPSSLISQLHSAYEKGESKFNMTGGEQLRDFIHVENVAEIIAKVAIKKMDVGVINCCSGQPISVRNFVEKYMKRNKIELELNFGFYPYNDFEPFAFWGDTKKLKKSLR